MTGYQADIAPSRSSEKWTLALVSASHFISHFYMLLLPPLFIALQADRGWSYTEISLALVAFYLTSTVLQTPAGYASDHLTSRTVLILGLALEALAIAAASMTSSLAVFVALFGLAGVGNTVFHPAHYAIMAHRIQGASVGNAYAIHTFAGFLGTAVAPATLLALSSTFGWRGALLASAAAGLAMAGILAVSTPHLDDRDVVAKSATAREGERGRSVLLRPEILLNLAVFVFLAAANSGIQGYTVAALVEVWGTPLALANSALSVFLFANAFGVLAGGVASRYFRSQEVLFGAGLFMVAASVAPLGFLNLSAPWLIAALAVGGLANGLILPARDLIVREITPPGQFGRVFGFVSTGFFVGAMVTPPAFAFFLDSGHPAWVFFATAGFSLACVALTAAVMVRRS